MHRPVHRGTISSTIPCHLCVLQTHSHEPGVVQVRVDGPYVPYAPLQQRAYIINTIITTAPLRGYVLQKERERVIHPLQVRVQPPLELCIRHVWGTVGWAVEIEQPLFICEGTPAGEL